uniref:Uncharacterized protein n=1 Tax=Tanacetum cinerariifolium TaxID=118510 RepID=A0A699KR15_TANCI|nr:hypothetical protein [Tanacetum cinerariifolium]
MVGDEASHFDMSVYASHSRSQYPTNINMSTSCSVFVSVFLNNLNSWKRLNFITKVVKLGSSIAKDASLMAGEVKRSELIVKTELYQDF